MKRPNNFIDFMSDG